MMKSIWLISLLVLMISDVGLSGRLGRPLNLRSATDPGDIIESLNTLRQNSFLDWISSILGPETIDSSGTPTKRDCPPCSCGGINTRHRIVGGQETEVNEYPWMAMLMWFGNFYCGATLINDQYALTAAHCVTGFYHRLITVRLLEHNRQNSSVKIADRRVSRVFIHPKYSTNTFDSDIALIRFNEPVRLGIDMHPVCLPTPNESFAGRTAVVTGWGALSEGGPISDTLQEVEVPILTQDECRNSKYGNKITDNMICAGQVEEGGKDSCQGDSGGPMHVIGSSGGNSAGSGGADNDNDQESAYELAGIVSWGEGCARPGLPGVYTRVNNFNKWIEQNTRDACACQPTSSSSSSTSPASPSPTTTTEPELQSEPTTGEAIEENSEIPETESNLLKID